MKNFCVSPLFSIFALRGRKAKILPMQFSQDTALLLVDIQNDFCAGGSLEVPQANEIIPVINKLLPLFQHRVATQDWHPASHKSFAANHPWRKPGQVIELNGLEQVLWPIHCVQESFGAEFHKELNTEALEHIVQKGTDNEIDSYSGFFDNGRKKSTNLHNLLQDLGVLKVYVVGLATDYCIKFTALDAKSLGYETYLIQDACKAVNMQTGDEQKALAQLQEAGVHLTESRNFF